MKIAIIGIGRMGSWLARELAGRHPLALFDRERHRLEAYPGLHLLSSPEELAVFQPELLINAVSLPLTIEVFRSLLPHLPAPCMLCDIASIKGELGKFYQETGRPFVSLHPMFGPTFASIRSLAGENAVLIAESHESGKAFFRHFLEELGVAVSLSSFAEHDRMMAYSLTLPFVSSLVFSSCVGARTVPGTTFRRHLEIARGLLAEDDGLLTEILFGPHSLGQLEKISSRLSFLGHVIRGHDSEEAHRFFASLRQKLKLDGEDGCDPATSARSFAP